MLPPPLHRGQGHIEALCGEVHGLLNVATHVTQGVFVNVWTHQEMRRPDVSSLLLSRILKELYSVPSLLVEIVDEPPSSVVLQGDMGQLMRNRIDLLRIRLRCVDTDEGGA